MIRAQRLAARLLFALHMIPQATAVSSHWRCVHDNTDTRKAHDDCTPAGADTRRTRHTAPVGDLAFEWNGKKWDKIPKDPATGYNAASDNPATWSTMAEAMEAYLKRNHAGIGYVFTAEDPYTGVDLDDVIDANNGIQPWASDEIDRLDTYTERSPRGAGVHMICRATAPACGKRGQVEMYDHGRFFAFTGAVLYGRATIQDRQGAIDALHMAHWTPAIPDTGHSSNGRTAATAIFTS